MTKLLVFCFCVLLDVVSCKQAGSLDLNVQTKDEALVVYSHEREPLTDVKITISSKDSENDYYYSIDTIPSRHEETISLTQFKDDGGEEFSGEITEIYIECDQGSWESKK